MSEVKEAGDVQPGKIVKYSNPKYDIKAPSFVDTSTEGLITTYNKPIDFQVPAVWGSQQQVTFNVTTQKIDMDYTEATLNFNLQISSSPTAMTAFPPQTPIAFAPDIAATWCDSYNFGLQTGGTIENPPGGQTDGIFVGDMIEFSNDWLDGQQGLQDAFILDDPGATQLIIGQQGQSSYVNVPATPYIVDVTQATSVGTPALAIDGTHLNLVANTSALLGVTVQTNSVLQTIATSDLLNIFLYQGQTPLSIYAVGLGTAGTSTAGSGAISKPFTIGPVASGIQLGTVSGTSAPLQLVSTGTTWLSTDTIQFYATSATTGAIPIFFTDVSLNPPALLKLSPSAISTVTCSIGIAAVGGASIVAGHSIVISGVNQIVTQYGSRGFWKRQALTDNGAIWSGSFKISRIVSFLRSYKKVITSGNFFLQFTLNANQIANMLQRAPWIPVGYVWATDIQLVLTQLNPSIAAERRLTLQPNEKIDFTWMRRRTVKITPVQSGGSTYEVSFSVLGEFIEFMVFTFKPTSYYGNQTSNFLTSSIPPSGASPPLPNPINQAFIQIAGGAQVPPSSYGQFPSDLAKIFQPLLELEHRKDEGLLSGPINIKNFLNNAFFFVFVLKYRPEVASFTDNAQNQVQTQFSFQSNFPVQYDVRVTTFSRANGRWRNDKEMGLVYEPRGFKDVGTG